MQLTDDHCADARATIRCHDSRCFKRGEDDIACAQCVSPERHVSVRPTPP